MIQDKFKEHFGIDIPDGSIVESYVLGLDEAGIIDNKGLTRDYRTSYSMASYVEEDKDEILTHQFLDERNNMLYVIFEDPDTHEYVSHIKVPYGE